MKTFAIFAMGLAALVALRSPTTPLPLSMI